jgi:hypothetical protein
MSRKRITKSSRKNQKASKEYAILGILILAIVVVLFRGKGSEPTRMAAEAPLAMESGKRQEVQVLSNNQPTVDILKYQEELNRERARFAQARELGLKALPLKNRGDKVTIPISFVPEKVWCQGGDLDTMKYASRNDRAKDFLITLEGIDRGGKNPFVRVSLDELYKGANFNFTIPKPKEATAYGLYICTDSRKENSCQRKSMQTHSKLSEQLAENPDKTRAEDRVFFFQNLVIDGRSVETYRTDDFSHDFQKSVSGHLTKKGLSASEIQTAWKTNSTLKSAPVDIRKNRIVLSLPYNDPRCLQGTAR